MFDFDMKEYVKMVKQDSYEDGLLEGKELGRLEGIEFERIRIVESFMKKFNIDLKSACEGVGITVEEYENVKKRDLK